MIDKHYMVKYETKALGTCYGIVDSYSEEAKKLPKGKLLVEDAVLPEARVVLESAVTDLKSDYEQKATASGDWLMYHSDELDDFVTLQHVLHFVRHVRLPKNRLAAGHLFATPVGDGAAHYCVVNVGKTNCQIEWRGFCPDRYTDRLFGYGGQFRVKDVAHLALMGELFGPIDKDSVVAINTFIPKFFELYGHVPRSVAKFAEMLDIDVVSLLGTAGKPARKKKQHGKV